MTKRVFYLDFLRSFAILMVLLLHSISEYIVQPGLFGQTSWYVNLFLNAFARTGVPLFFMISGSLILSSDLTENFGQFYKRRLLHIVVPLLFWDTVYFVYKCARGYIHFNLFTLLSEIINCGTEYHLWYLYTLIGIYLLAPFLRILIKQCSMKQLVWLLVLMSLCTTIRPFVNTVTPLYFYLFEPLFNGYVTCFLMGYILSKLEYDKKSIAVWLAVGVLGVIGSVVLNHIHSSLNGINMVANYGYSLSHYLLAAAVFALSKYVFGNRTILEKYVTVLAKHSFGVYLIHVIFIDLILDFFMIDASPICSSFYIFVLTFACSLIAALVFGRSKYLKKTIM